MAENKLDIAMVYNPCAYADEFSNHIFDYKPTKTKLALFTLYQCVVTLPQKRHKCAFRCRPSLSNEVNSSACVPSSTLILYDDTSLDERVVDIRG